MAADDYLYHVTYYGRLGNIARSGLVPGRARSIGAPSLDSHARGRVFYTDPEGVFFWHSKAEEHAEANSDDVLEDELIPVVLRVDLNAFEDDSLEEDEIGSEDARADAWLVDYEMPPEEIEVFDGSSWIPVEDFDSIDPATAIFTEVELSSDDDEPVDLHYFKDRSPLMPPEVDPRR